MYSQGKVERWMVRRRKATLNLTCKGGKRVRRESIRMEAGGAKFLLSALVFVGSKTWW